LIISTVVETLEAQQIRLSPTDQDQHLEDVDIERQYGKAHRFAALLCGFYSGLISLPLSRSA
jgi:hypothetical protein